MYPIPYRPDRNPGFSCRRPIGHILSFGGTGGLYLDINLEFLLRPPIVHVLTYWGDRWIIFGSWGRRVKEGL